MGQPAVIRSSSTGWIFKRRRRKATSERCRFAHETMCYSTLNAHSHALERHWRLPLHVHRPRSLNFGRQGSVTERVGPQIPKEPVGFEIAVAAAAGDPQSDRLLRYLESSVAFLVSCFAVLPTDLALCATACPTFFESSAIVLPASREPCATEWPTSRDFSATA